MKYTINFLLILLFLNIPSKAESSDNIFKRRLYEIKKRFHIIPFRKYKKFIPFNFCKHGDTTFRCVKFVRNYDGDTITVNIPNIHPLFGNEMSVRLLGIDTAEIRTSDECEKEMAYKAKEFVYEQIKDIKRFKLINAEKDKYFRIAADVIINGKSLSQMLLDEGLAYPYDGGTKADVDWCSPLDEQDLN